MTETTMTRKMIIIGALAAVSLLALHAQAQVQVIEYQHITSPNPTPEAPPEVACENMYKESGDKEKLQKCLDFVREDYAREHPFKFPDLKPDPIKQFLPDHGTCQHLLDKDDYVNYEACMRFYTGLPH
jgi:hypothetical protein